MGKGINLYWYKMPNGQKNFGDELGPFIVSQLSGSKVNYISFVGNFAFVFYKTIRKIVYYNLKLGDIKELFYPFYKRNTLITIGSIISIPQRSDAHIWGAGIISRGDNIHKANFHAVRGKYTQLRLKELGLNVPNILGDPAILLPLIIKPSVPKHYKLGIIPHYIHYPDLKKRFFSDEILVINLLDDIEEVVKNILSCDCTISTSLHGLITSHIYNVPSLWFTLSDKKLAGDDVKFFDYFSSVNIDEYKPFILYSSNNIIDEVYKKFEKYKSISNINIDLTKMQIDLLKAAPFTICKEYSYLLV